MGFSSGKRCAPRGRSPRTRVVGNSGGEKLSAPLQRVVVRRIRGTGRVHRSPHRESTSPLLPGAPAEIEAPAPGLSGLAAPTGILTGVALGGLFWLALFAVVEGLTG